MNIMKEAHRLTKEIVKEFPNVDYKTQLGICISYLYKEGGEKEMTAVEAIENEVKTIAGERGYKDDYKVSVNPWKTKDESKQRIYINVTIGKKMWKAYLDCINEKLYYDNGNVSVINEVIKRVIPIVKDNAEELMGLIK